MGRTVAGFATGRPRRWGWFGMLIVAAGLLGGSATGWAQTSAGAKAAAAIPQPWLAYAQLAGRQFQAWLESDGAQANELHQFLEQRILHPVGDVPPAAITVRAWFGDDGRVTRVAFDSLGDAKADDDLRALLTAHPMTEAPPPDMPQPLRVRLGLQANPDAEPAAASGASDAP